MVTRVLKANAAASTGQKAQRIKIPKMAESVASELRKMIVRGELREGDFLVPEAELMEQFGISRPTLREAIRILESESLLSITRGSREGARIHLPDHKVAARYFGLVLQSSNTTLIDVYRARAVIEPPSVRILATDMRKTAPAALRQVVAEESAVIDDDTHLSHASARFHEMLVELSGNQTLALVMKMLHEIFARHQTAVTVGASDRTENTKLKRKGIRSQEKLIELIEAGDPDSAEAFWRLHLENYNKTVFHNQQYEQVIDLLE